MQTMSMFRRHVAETVVNFHQWRWTAETAGCSFPIRKRYEVEPYYEHQNKTGTAPNRPVNALGFVLSMYF